MIINFMKNSALDMLISDIPDNTSFYNSKDKWIDRYFEEKGFGSYSFSTGIMVPDVDLIIGDSKSDYDNAIRLFDAFKDKLNPVQASDLRLWAYLAHYTYWDYMRERWAIDVASEEDEDDAGRDKIVSRIGARYFFKASKGKAFVRQGIARLYWSAYLTYDEDNGSNPYEMTEYFLSKQDIFAVSTERSLARHKTLLLAALKVLKAQGELKRHEIRNYFLNLNQAGGIIVFESLSKEDALELAKRTLDETLIASSGSDIKEDIFEGKELPKQKVNETIPTEEAITNDKVVTKNSKLTVRNTKNNAQMLIVVRKSKFKTKPDLVGLKEGDRFKISKGFWVIQSVE